MNVGCLIQATLNSTELERRLDEIADVISNLYFMYVGLGVVVGAIVSVGVVCNILVLVVLCNRLMLSAPTCLLQALTVNDIFIMLNSIYSDVQPAITSYLKASSMDFSLGECKQNNTEGILEDFMRKLFEEAFRNFTLTLVDNSSASVGLFNGEGYDTDASNLTTDGKLLKRKTVNFTIGTTRGDVSVGINSNGLMIKALEHFIAYTIMTFGLVIMLALAVERTIAVVCPLKAASIVTVKRTRIAIIVIFIACVIIHSFQFLKEIILVNHYPEKIRSDDYQGRIMQPYRIDHERFYVISCLIICVLLMVLNSLLLRKILEFQKVRKKAGTVIKAKQRNEMNVTFLVVTLIFVQFPVSVFTVVMSFISLEDFINNLTTITRLTTSLRIIIVSTSAFNFIIYCFLSSKFRRVFVRIYCEKLTAAAKRKGKTIGQLQHRSGRTSSDNYLGNTDDNDRTRKTQCNGNPLRKDTNELILLMEIGTVMTNSPKVHHSGSTDDQSASV